MIASPARNTFSEVGMCDPRRASTPSANAMSVADVMAQPRAAAGSLQLKARKISAGTAMPPAAAMPGRARRLQVES